MLLPVCCLMLFMLNRATEDSNADIMQMKR